MLNLKEIFPANTLMGKLLRLPLKVISENAYLPIISGPAKGFKWQKADVPHYFWLGYYDPDIQKIARKVLKYGDVVYDIGAHYGFFTLVFSKLVGNDGLVCAFEPSPKNLHYLEQHLHINQIKNVKVIKAAVGDKLGKLKFREDSRGFTSQFSEDGEIEVDVITLDHYIQTPEARIPNLIKINIEGAETFLLKEADNLLSKHRPKILLSTHGEEIRKECVSILKSYNYELKLLMGNNNKDTLEEADKIFAY